MIQIPAILREIASFGGSLNEKGPPPITVLHMHPHTHPPTHPPTHPNTHSNNIYKHFGMKIMKILITLLSISQPIFNSRGCTSDMIYTMYIRTLKKKMASRL